MEIGKSVSSLINDLIYFSISEIVDNSVCYSVSDSIWFQTHKSVWLSVNRSVYNFSISFSILVSNKQIIWK